MADTGAQIHAFMVTFDRVDATVRAIEALLAQSRPPDTVLVVNNGSAADGATIAAAHPQVRVLDSGNNIGPAGGWALGIEELLRIASDDDWILFADDDTPPPDGHTVEHLLHFAVEQVLQDTAVAGVGMVGGRYDSRRGDTIRVRDEELVGPIDVDTIGGGHWPLLHVAAVRPVGLPDASLFFGFEELEYFLKVRRSGGRLVIDGDAWRQLRLRNSRVGVTSSDLRRVTATPWRAYYSTRNPILIARRFGTRWAPWHAAGRGLARATRALVLRRRPQETRAHLSGLLDGLRGRSGRRWVPPS